MKAVAYKTSDYLKTQDDIFHYIDSALEDGNKEILLEALRNIAIAKGGIENLAKETGLNHIVTHIFDYPPTLYIFC